MTKYQSFELKIASFFLKSNYSLHIFFPYCQIADSKIAAPPTNCICISLQRNDMVEYFGEQLSGFAFTVNGWVQSYGSRCVKPPIIYGDVSRPKPMTVFWSSLAQSFTKRPMKGMLTGPVTILNWSFVRNDQPRYKHHTLIMLEKCTSRSNKRHQRYSPNCCF